MQSFQDLRHAIRVLRRNPSFTAGTLLTLTLGIGATMVVFSIVYGVLLRPLPYVDADRLVRLSEVYPGVSLPHGGHITNVTYYAWVDRSPQAIESLAAYKGREYTVGFPGNPARVRGAEVSPALFPVLRVRPELGRFFGEGEAGAGANLAVVLSTRLWETRFGGRRDLVGQALSIDGRPHIIVGIAPRGFAFPDGGADLWTPYVVERPLGANPEITIFFALARLKLGYTANQAEAEGTAVTRALGETPLGARVALGAAGPATIRVNRLVDDMTSEVKPALLLVSSGVVCVLLIVCVNVANLFLSRSVARERELATRAALGAPRARLVRELLAESLVLSTLGAALACLLLTWSLPLLLRLAPADFPRLGDIRVDVRVLTFALALALFTTVASALIPALRATRVDLADRLRGADGASGGGFRATHAQRVRDALIVLEAAFAVVLLVAATLLTRSLVRLTGVDPGYDPESVLTARVFVPGGDDAAAQRRRQLLEALLERARALPGVVAAGGGNMMPLDGASFRAGFPAPGSYRQANATTPSRVAVGLRYTVTPGYAEALGLRLRAGRFFSPADVSSPGVTWVVNQEFARLYLPADPVGMRFPWSRDNHDADLEIIGIVDNVLKDGLDQAPEPAFYVPLREPVWGDLLLLIRTVGDPGAVAPALRQVVAQTAPDAAVELVPLQTRLGASVDRPRSATGIFVGFGLLALALASIGLHAAISYSLSQRWRELGLRAALGADRRELLRMVMREGLGRAVVGIILGLIAAAGLAHLMKGLLFEIPSLDPVAFVASPILLIVVAALACLRPALNASAADPADALRQR